MLAKDRGSENDVKAKWDAFVMTLSARAQALPPIDDDLIAILGRPNFQCIHSANALRSGGQKTAKQAENEQAAVIRFLLGHYLAGPAQYACAST